MVMRDLEAMALEAEMTNVHVAQHQRRLLKLESHCPVLKQILTDDAFSVMESEADNSHWRF